MRQFYIRLVIGLVWLGAAIVSLFNSNFLSSIMYLIPGILFIVFAGVSWKKANEKKHDE